MSWSIAGMSAVTSVGDGVDEVFAALCAGRSGIASLRAFAHERFRARHAYEVDDRRGGADTPGRASRWLLRAIDGAVRDAGLQGELAGVPILVGTGLRELRSLELWDEGGAADVELGDLHFGGRLRRELGAAETYTFANACSASLYALAFACDLLDVGDTDAVVVAGVDAITESMFGLLDRVHMEPPDAVRPFERTRKGVLMGEGAAAVVLRRADDRGPRHARLRSVGISCDAHHPTAPDPAGIRRAILDAHERAAVTAAEVDVVLAHGTGTILNDQAEAAALATVFGDSPSPPLVTAIKSMTGHTSGGSGLLGVVVAAEVLRSGQVPPTIGLADPLDEGAALRFVRGRAVTSAELSVAQVDAFGFGGVNAVAVLDREAA